MPSSSTENQNPEQQARDHIDAQLSASGWVVQHQESVKKRARKKTK